ncbi:MAG: hypothetical protein RIR70_165 [Pseudomonadota bacterium]
MKINKPFKWPAALLLGAGCLPTFLPSAWASDDTVIITANRVAQTADETLAAVSVITRQEIERSQARSLDDLLRGQTGLEVANQGGLGKQTSVFLRGTNSGHVLVLIDGVKIGSASTGLVAFQDLPLDAIERIEIVRGPRASLYGSEAIGGVIQIFTRKGGGAARPSLSLGAGSYGTWQASAGVSGGLGEASWYRLGVSEIDSKGINACRGSASAGCFTTEPDRDGYRNLSTHLRLGSRFSNGLETEASWLRADGRNDYDGSFQNRSGTRQDVLGISLAMPLGSLWRTSLKAGRSVDESQDYKDATPRGNYKTERTSLSWQNDIMLHPSHLLSLGVDWLDDKLKSSTQYDRGQRDNTGFFAQYLGDMGRHNLQLSARHDDNSQFGTVTTGSAAYGFAISDTLRLYASVGNAFKAPTFNDLYFPGFSNPALKPERSNSREIGISGTMQASRWGVNVFETRVRDLIGYDMDFNLVNVDTAKIRGMEWQGATRAGQWDWTGNLTLTDPKNDMTRQDLPRRARQALMLGADREFGALRAGVKFRAEGHRFDDAANTRRLGGFATTDLQAEYRLDKNWRVQGRIENLFDRSYETVYLYNQPGRAAFVTLRYQP